MQSIIYSTILSILSIEAVPHVQFYNTYSLSIIREGNTGIIIKPDNTFHAMGYKLCSRTADLSKYGENNFQNINSSKVKINVPTNHGQLLHIPNSGSGWRTNNKRIIKKVLKGNKYITDNDCGLTVYYSEEGELLYFKNNGIIKKNIFLKTDLLSDNGSYYVFKFLVWVFHIEKPSGQLFVSVEPKNTPIDESSHESSSESEKDDFSEYETANSEFSDTSENDKTAEEFEINLSPTHSESKYYTPSESDHDN